MRFKTVMTPEGIQPFTGNELYDVDSTIAQAQALVDADEALLDGEAKGKMLPTPTGYRMLCALPKVAEKTSGGILRTDDARSREEVASALLLVLAMGPDCYKDTKKFPSGPWCKVGSFILCRPYAGTRFKVRGQEFRLINDDQCEAEIEDPRGFSRF